ncbi:lytic transglycosylase domain-containing protein [Thiomonas sp.]
MTPVLLLHQCAPQVSVVTMAAIIKQESSGNPLALHDNTTGKSYRPASLAEAAKLAADLIQQGHSVDIGLGQINNRNLRRLHLKAEQVLDPCTNIRAAQTILLRGWKQSRGDLRGALAAYNTGNTGSAVGAQYAAQVFGQAGVIVPAIPGGKLPNLTFAVGPTRQAVGGLPPVRPEITSTPQASPLSPRIGALAVALR